MERDTLHVGQYRFVMGIVLVGEFIVLLVYCVIVFLFYWYIVLFFKKHEFFMEQYLHP